MGNRVSEVQTVVDVFNIPVLILSGGFVDVYSITNVKKLKNKTYPFMS